MILGTEAINVELGNNNDWQIRNGKLAGEFEFADFKEAINFINEIAAIAETLNHHPSILVNYNKVVLTLWTHSENGITEKDTELANKISNIKSAT